MSVYKDGVTRRDRPSNSRITTRCEQHWGIAGIPRKLQPFKSRRRNRECRHADSQQALPKRVGLSDSLRGDVPEEGVTVAAGVNGPPYAGARRSAHCAYGAGERSRVGHLATFRRKNERPGSFGSGSRSPGLCRIVQVSVPKHFCRYLSFLS